MAVSLGRTPGHGDRSVRIGCGLFRAQVGESFREQAQAAVEPPLHGARGNAKHVGHFGLPQPLDPHQVEGDAELLSKLTDADYPGRVERAVVFTVAAWDMNCPQHIHQRYSRSLTEPIQPWWSSTRRTTY